MKTYQQQFDKNQTIICSACNFEPDILLVFSGIKNLNSEQLKPLREQFPEAIMMGCSTAGEIAGEKVLEQHTVVTAVKFDNCRLQYRQVNVSHPDDSEEAGRELGTQLMADDLKHVFVLSEGLQVNGTLLVNGFRQGLPGQVSVSGGLAGDGSAFERTYIITNQGQVIDKAVAAIGFYGDNLQVGCGSTGGWKPFGIERRVTRSHRNVVYEIDNQPALNLYKSFLGSQADDLPASGLLFPISMRLGEDHRSLVRTILAVDEKAQSLTFAGDIPEGSQVQLMKANVDNLIEGARMAAQHSYKKMEGSELSLLISCVGRKLVLKQLAEEEIEAVREVHGKGATIAGFYSYGEIAPFWHDDLPELHNQTMTITTIREG